MSCYLYAVAPATAEAAVPQLRGVAGAAVTTLREDELVAVVSQVPDEEFTEEALRRRLEDLDHLEAIARAHHGVVDALAAGGPVLPLRLATVYRDLARVREVLHERRAEFAQALASIGDRMEWGVKIYAREPEPAAAPAPARSPAGGRSGRAYLEQRLRQRREREDGRRGALELCRRVDAELRAAADDVRHHRPQDPRLSGAHDENLLNAAYLVRRDRAGHFAELVRGLAERERGVRVELTGPWAPYSFTAAQQG
jgi:Gas vesicle synthesis protein GvpL/GvpF